MTDKKTTPQEFDDKHVKIMDAIMPFARKAKQKNLTTIAINNVTRKSRIRFFLLPEWAKNFPPYNLARLLSVVKRAGYCADAVDLNARAWSQHTTWDIDFDPWHGSKEWRWMGDSYYTHLHEHMVLMLEEQIKQIGEDGVTVVGFSLYYCNQSPTDWMAAEIKRRYPHIKIIVGGPQCHAFPPDTSKPYDYVVSGEGEQLILEVLEKIENNDFSKEQVVLRQAMGERLDLDTMPWPDYSHFDLSEYAMPNGINAEFSRGCTAKCVFCSETHFWKYRGRAALDTVEEIVKLHNEYGIDFIWFLDSLVNGNLKELQAFCKGIIASGIKIRWTGYSRCDHRMDSDFYRDLAGSGCYMLSYGIESGSNKVLRDMDKQVTVDEIEQNLKSGLVVGVEAHSNWILGFPTEEYQDFYDSMVLVARNNMCFNVVAAGHGFTEPPDTILSQNSEKYGLSKSYYQNNWITSDLKNSKVHRAIRLVSFNIMLNTTPTRTGVGNFANFDTSKYYNIKFNQAYKYNKIKYETYDFNIIQPNINPLADSVVNEIWPLLRLLYLVRGGYHISISITPEQIYNEFGDRLGCELTAIYDFTISNEGAWQADFNFNFKQDDDAWKYHDYGRETSSSAQRARALAIPGSKGDVMWTMDKYKEDLIKLDELRKHDFSFEYNFKGSGTWQ